MRLLRFILLTVLIFAVARWLKSIPVPALDLDHLTEEANLVVTGEVSAVRDVGSTQIKINSQDILCRVEIGTLKVDQVLKGESSTPQLIFQYYMPRQYVGWKTPTINSHAVFFFKTATAGKYTFTDNYYPSVPTVSGVPIAGTSPIDRVIGAISAVLTSDRTSANEKANALFTISRSQSAASTQALRSALNSPDGQIRITAASALLERNDTIGLSSLREFLLNTPNIPQNLLVNLSYVIGERLRDSKAIPDLTALLRSNSPQIRKVAASGLVHTHSQDAIGPLIGVLSDSDTEVRYYAVIGLAEITGQLSWRPSREEFGVNESKYLKHWQEWAEAQPKEPAGPK